eukprot:4317690-Amphidinium_carterae.1
MGELRKLPKVRANFVSLVDVGLKATLSLERRKAAWARLSCNDSNLPQVLDEADELHTEEVVAVEDGAAEEGEETDECEAEDVREQVEDEVEDVWEGCEPAQEEDVQASTVQANDTRTLSRFVALRMCMEVHAALTLQLLPPLSKY